MKLKITTSVLLLLILIQTAVSAQEDSVRTDTDDPYNVNYKWEVPAAAAFLGSSYFGFRALDKHASFTAADIAKLNPQNINAFDRPIALLNPSGFAYAQRQSNLFLDIAIVSPAILLLDKKVRHHWADFVTMLAVSHCVNNALYFGSVLTIRRGRPLTYNPAVPLSAKIGEGKSNSFFSGHVSFSATSTFFAATLFTDYHHIKGWKRMAIYAGAAVPPALVGYYRMRAGKHFKSDVITGLIIGASSGIVIPALHRFSEKHKNLSVQPFYIPGYSGMSLSYHIR